MSTHTATADDDTQPQHRHRTGEAIARYAAPIALLALFIIFFIATPNFLTASNMTALFV